MLVSECLTIKWQELDVCHGTITLYTCKHNSKNGTVMILQMVDTADKVS